MTREEFELKKQIENLFSDQRVRSAYKPMHEITKMVMDIFAAQQRINQPAAEGAEEILDNLDLGEPLQSGEFYYRSEVVKAMQEFATLHAQKMAEKMVEEKMREELIAYGKVVRSWGIAIPSDILECSIDEYLKSRER